MILVSRLRRSGKRARWAAGALGVLLAAAPGCSQRITHNRLFALFGLNGGRGQAPKTAAVARPAVPKAKPNPDEALREVFRQQARGAFNPATDDRRVRSLQTRLRLDSEDLAARLEMAGIYEAYRLYDDALDQYTEAFDVISRTAGPFSGANGTVEEKAALGLGRTARAAHRGSEALPVLAAFLKRFPSAEAWNELGLLYEETGDRGAAEEAFRQAVARQPDSGPLHNNLGYNLLLQNKPEAAEAEFRRALESHPKSTAAHNNLGIVLARRGEIEAARRQFRLAAGDAATASNNLAVVLLEMGEYERSRGELLQALTARRYFAPALTNFKLVQDLLRQRAELITAGGRLPLATARIPAGLTLAALPDRATPDPAGTAEPTAFEDRP